MVALDLSPLFRPRSVALVGATERSNWSVNTFNNLRRYSPDVTVHCVSPSRQSVHGMLAAPTLTALGEPVDLAYIMAPRQYVPDLVREAGTLGIRGAVVLTAGFGETEDGKALQRELVAAAAETGVRVLGPNVSGYIDVGRSIVPFGLALPALADPGGASFVLQSGGLMKPVLSLANAWGIGVGSIIGTGNEAALSTTDVAAHLLDDPQTRAIGLFVEGFRDPGAFRALARRADELDRPIVALAVGRSDVARRAALSHTGSLAGDSLVTSAVLADLGVVEVHSMEELVATTGLLAAGVRPAGDRVAVVGASGGGCELIADKAADVGLRLPDLPEPAMAGLKELLPDFSDVHNPLDVTGYATVDIELPIKAAEVIAGTAADDYDVVLFQAFVTPPDDPPDPGGVRRHFTAIAETAHALGIPLLLQDEVAAGMGSFARGLFRELGLIRLPGVEVGLRALAHAVRYTGRRSRPRNPAPPLAAPREPLPAGNGRWSEAQALAALREFGLPAVPFRIAGDEGSAVAYAREFGGPVALKVVSPDIAHKTEAGGVELGIHGDAEVAAAYRRMHDTVARRAPGAAVDGVLVAPMRAGGVELIIGVNRDPTWGPILLVGLGGVLVEVLQDVALRPLPVTADDVHTMLAGLKGAALLDGPRGTAPVDHDALARAVASVAAAAQAWGDRWESIEVNPLRVDGSLVEALDALVQWRSTGTDATK
ncbi:acetate--CoA ligase family protein [Dactylosporangium sp. CA-139066]|uniref:acetate--CoA ligase family protein n=1 Tax=Dactylosporangium sp. CA-139066 TaxID=3239930 RepID=UPI003D8B31BC